MKNIYTFTIILLFVAVNAIAGGKCEVVNFAAYEALQRGWGFVNDYYARVEITITKTQCAEITIRNLTNESIYIPNYELTATFADNTHRTVGLHLSEISNIDQSGRQFTVSKCFGVNLAPIINIECN